MIGDVACTTLRHTIMFTYSQANTPLGQSERAYYLSYFIKRDRLHQFYHHNHYHNSSSLLTAKYFASANAQLKEQHDDNKTTTELTTIKPDKNSKPAEKQKDELIENYNRFHKRWMDELLSTKLR